MLVFSFKGFTYTCANGGFPALAPVIVKVGARMPGLLSTLIIVPELPTGDCSSDITSFCDSLYEFLSWNCAGAVSYAGRLSSHFCVFVFSRA